MAMLQPHLEPTALHVLFTLDEATGRLVWKSRPVSHFKNQTSCNRWNRRFAGTTAGSISKGHRTVTIDCRGYKAHHIVFAMHHGRWPESDVVDHENRIRDDNRPGNLREATFSQNLMNRGPDEYKKARMSRMRGDVRDHAPQQAIL